MKFLFTKEETKLKNKKVNKTGNSNCYYNFEPFALFGNKDKQPVSAMIPKHFTQDRFRFYMGFKKHIGSVKAKLTPKKER